MMLINSPTGSSKAQFPKKAGCTWDADEKEAHLSSKGGLTPTTSRED